MTVMGTIGGMSLTIPTSVVVPLKKNVVIIIPTHIAIVSPL